MTLKHINNQKQKMNLNQVCDEVDNIITGTDNQIDYKYIFIHLEEALTKKTDYNDVELVCDTVLKIATTKNRRIRHLEKYFWKYLNNIPIRMAIFEENNFDEQEELLPNTDYDDTSKRIFSRLLGLALEIINLKEDNRNASDLRRSGSLELLSNMHTYYHIPIAKKLFVDSINSKNKNEQYAALMGLENYYEESEDELEEEIIERLDLLRNKTKDRTVASTCLQIQINAGIIDEMTAVLEMDDWKDEHYNF